MANTGDVSVGTVLRFNGELCQVVEWQHRTPGNLRAFYQGKMRNLKTGKTLENRFRSGEEVEIARVDYKTMEYLYSDGENLICMDHETYEQVPVPQELFGNSFKFLKEVAKITQRQLKMSLFFINILLIITMQYSNFVIQLI